MSIESLLTTKVIEAVKQCYDADVDKDLPGKSLREI